MTIAISILSIYAFILLGFMAKKMLKEQMNEKGMILMSIYFLQPMLSFWGLSTKPIQVELLEAPFWYLVISFICILISGVIGRLFFKEDIKEKSIITICVVLGNTGNLGIPLGMALFGEASIIYMSMINLTNVFVVYTLGVFFYSRGNCSIKQSLLNIVKLPVIWFATLAVLMNIFDIKLHPAMQTPLQMGAYCTMVIQLVIFGMYLYNIKLRSINYKLLFHVSIIKFIITPLIAGWILYSMLELEPMLATLIFIELIVPLAVTNVNLAALYECKPLDVTAMVFFTSLIFIPFFILVSNLLHYLHIVSLP
ncbi:AEC family transporter [Sulfurospirillum deleyianum]|uniref:Auxin Efflux Carrier n=1 Tax=Sulfurospirillum deleyianum (strain ATCC 51133 / DSM 6946 / 5175) TaxID=525898 RepID=D1AZV8_SULD5|nr:AEC family transporter [Sulfurospirillum deleyianum]ACZ11575.1 Auxin Efflux Carrier [Sulfurospirillum deleyianum DSM 6946]